MPARGCSHSPGVSRGRSTSGRLTREFDATDIEQVAVTTESGNVRCVSKTADTVTVDTRKRASLTVDTTNGDLDIRGPESRVVLLLGGTDRGVGANRSRTAAQRGADGDASTPPTGRA